MSYLKGLSDTSYLKGLSDMSYLKGLSDTSYLKRLSDMSYPRGYLICHKASIILSQNICNFQYVNMMVQWPANNHIIMGVLLGLSIRPLWGRCEQFVQIIVLLLKKIMNFFF